MSSSENTSAELFAHLDYLEARLAESVAAPLSARKAMLVALLVDSLVDRLFRATPGAGDVLEFRAALAAQSEAIGLVLALTAMRPEGPRLVTEAVAVPIADYPRLEVEDFMVSLYNSNTVQRVRIAEADGTRHDAHEVLGAAAAALRERIAHPNAG